MLDPKKSEEKLLLPLHLWELKRLKVPNKMMQQLSMNGQVIQIDQIYVTDVEVEASPSVPIVGLLRRICWIRYPSLSE